MAYMESLKRLVAVDGFVLSKCNGMSYCLQSILNAIPAECRSRFVIIVPKCEAAIESVPAGYEVKILNCSSFLLWSNVVLPYFLLKNFSRVSKVFHPANTMPFLSSSFFENYLLLHDVMFLRELSFSSLKHRLNHLYYKMNLFFSLKAVDKIITVSNFSKSDICSYFSNIHSDDITVIDESAKKFPRSESVKLPVGRIYLSVCLSDPRKNSILSVEGFLRYSEHSANSDSTLVLFGDPKYWEALKQRFTNVAGFSERVLFVGRVSDGQLAFLYQNAHAFLFPSSYEGFGLPVLEAMSFGTPVVTSRVTSLGEVAGEAGVYIEEFSAEQIAGALVLLDDAHKYADFKQRSLANVRRYSWDRSAELLLKLFNS
ncbi:glycosyltransferase family 4 protein [Shewanella avicenniae]|uniref:Glycosyltransferase family 4 protein n=1 Tax=Shewanella avicenniae TaxID=2814294 RepID=A0ABX7QPA4_9GAMM|nr:glycosyltransferase family 1 protein [Shewanella avicenniae]QSX32683.1 glycosyltransferase family 4 protein [Shewanella avicenniae]